MNTPLNFAERSPVAVIFCVVAALTLGVLSATFGQNIPALW